MYVPEVFVDTLVPLFGKFVGFMERYIRAGFWKFERGRTALPPPALCKVCTKFRRGEVDKAWFVRGGTKVGI